MISNPCGFLPVNADEWSFCFVWICVCLRGLRLYFCKFGVGYFLLFGGVFVVYFCVCKQTLMYCVDR